MFADATSPSTAIARVEWRTNGGPWQDATATDGAFNASSEGYTFTTPALRNGGLRHRGPRHRQLRQHDPPAGPARRRRHRQRHHEHARRWPAVRHADVRLDRDHLPAHRPRARATRSRGPTGLQYRWDYRERRDLGHRLLPRRTTSHELRSAGLKTARVEVREVAGAVNPDGRVDGGRRQRRPHGHVHRRSGMVFACRARSSSTSTPRPSRTARTAAARPPGALGLRGRRDVGHGLLDDQDGHPRLRAGLRHQPVVRSP